MKYLKIIFYSIFLFFISCSKEKNSDTIEKIFVPESYLSLKVENNHQQDIEVNSYLIIHDSEGNLIDYLEYKDGDEIELKTKEGIIIPEYFTITKFRHTLNQENNYFYVDTYPNIKKGVKLDFKTSFQVPSSTGNFSWKLSNIPNWKHFVLSSDFGDTTFASSYYYYFSNPSRPTDEIGSDTQSIIKSDFILSILDENYLWKYVKLPNVANNDIYSFDDSDLLSFDSELTITLPENYTFSTYVVGLNNDANFYSNGNFLNQFFYDPLQSTETLSNISLGYLDEYVKFKTHFSSGIGNYNHSIYLFGNKPTEIIPLAKPAFTINNSTFNNLSFTTDVEYIGGINSWAYNDSQTNNYLSWNVYFDGKAIPFVGQLPEKILLNNPNLDLSNMTYTSTNLKLKGQSVEEIVSERFGQNVITTDHTEEYLTFNNL